MTNHLTSRARAFLYLLLGFASGCNGSTEDGSGGTCAADCDPPVKLPNGLADGWNEIKPGGATICAGGAEYSFFVRPGKVNKVVVDFIGGGACWNEFTCSLAGTIFKDSVDYVRETVTDAAPIGIYDHAHTANPVADWYHVLVPYCTGDIHWGDSVATYKPGDKEFTINHKGAVNARAVLDYVYENFSAPEQVLMTGCSAGSYASVLWASYVMKHYPKSRILQFGDSGAGVSTADFYSQSFPVWNASAVFPGFISDLDPSQNDVTKKRLPDLYVAIANHFPTQWFGQYNAIHDNIQHFFYQAMGGGDVNVWSSNMLASVDEIESRAHNFRSYVAPGPQHCILTESNFYSVTANGVKLTTFLADAIEGRGPASVRCQGAECDLAETP